MAKNIKKVAEAMDAEIVGQVPETGGGPLGAARLARINAQRTADMNEEPKKPKPAQAPFDTDESADPTTD